MVPASRHCHWDAPLPLMRPAIKPRSDLVSMSTRTLPKSRRELDELLLEAGAPALPLSLIASKEDASLRQLTDVQRNWVEAREWVPKPGAVLLLPSESGGVAGALLGVGSEDWGTQSPLLAGALPAALPPGDYHFASPLPDPLLAT